MRDSDLESQNGTNDRPVVGYRRDDVDIHPPYDYPDYKSTLYRHPLRPLIYLPHTLTEATGPLYGHSSVRDSDADLTQQHSGEPLGERIIVSGQLLDGDGRPVENSLIEIWQANAAGRYSHRVDQHPAPLDPNFTGAGRCLTDGDGRYEFITVKPGAYPWGNHSNAWRPAHIHFSVFGPAFATRLITQMYFPGDPLFAYDPIFQSVRDPRDRERLVCSFDLSLTKSQWALGYRFDIVVRGRKETPIEVS
ncbi:MAG: protocatechuate 3,4-dioxygenase subunit beta [Chloroflexota bacterium]